MSALLYYLRADLRRGWRSLVVIAVFVALAGGATLAAIAAARRTDTAFPRMVAATGGWDVTLNPNNGSESHLTMAALRRLPGVQRIAREDGVILFPSIVKSVSDAFTLPPDLVIERDAGYTIGRPVITAGHMPAPNDATGVFVDRTFARQMSLHVGQSVHFVLITPAMLQQLQTVKSEAEARRIFHDAPRTLQGQVHIAGIGVAQDGVVVNTGYTPAGFVFTPAFRAAHPDMISPYWGAMVKLAPGTNLDRFTARVRALVPDESVAFERASAVATDVKDSTDPEVFALDAFAAFAALLGVVVVGQALARRMQLDSSANPTLAVLGTTRVQRMAVSLTKAMLAVVVGAVLAVAIAVAASPLGPVGEVRVAEVHPGVAFDGPVLLLGLAAIIAIGAALAALPAWRSARLVFEEPVPSRSRVAAAVTATGASLPAAIGLRFALEPESRRAGIPVRTTLVAAASAVALVTAVVVFSASIDHLVATPRLYGSAWDGQIELDNLNTPAGFNNDASPATLLAIEKQFVDVANRSGSITDSEVLQVGEVKAGPVAIPAIGYAASRHGIAPTIAAGRAPAKPDEIALGATTMSSLHTHIGGTIELAEHEQGPSRPLKVVGRAILPGLAPYPGSDKAGLGTGADLTEAGWRKFSSDFQKTQYVFRWAPHASTATLTRTFEHQMPTQLPLTVSPINHPSGVVSMQNLRSTPTALGSLVAVLLAAAVGNALVVTIRRRRRELAVLRTLGFTPGQVVRTVLWQAATVALVAVAVGIPAGIIVGRWTWTQLANHLGTLHIPVVPTADLVGVAAVVFVLATLVAIVPGLRAARTPARILHAE
jgi:hypothetical protein